MTLASGVRLGPYEIVSAVGAGGMGEVYRARDTKLNRDVAVKVLPTPFAADPDRLARFQREAQVLASLNHPNIAQIHGLEESEGVRALVMEFVEGPTLADRIAAETVGGGKAARGLPLNEALAIARQIMDALEAAHEQGIIHRDLKPANVKVRPDGAVKVLDFGLAKALTEPGSASGALSQSPTLTSPAATRVGVILGTASYMSPEQARGRAVDKRTDIWAFGCVLYEMLTGRRTFGGEDVTEVMGAVIHKEPDWRALDASTPATVRNTLRRCLEKDPKERLRDIGDVRLALAGAFDSGEGQAATTPQPAWRRVAALAIAALVASAATGALVWFFTRPEPAAIGVPVRFSLSPAPAAQLGQFLVLSPNGGALAFFAADSGTVRLWLHSLETGDTQVLTRAGTVSGAPFWSADGRFIGYTGEGKLKKIDPSGGPPEVISDAPAAFAGGTWSQDDIVVFAEAQRGLMRVAAAGGTPTPLTIVDPQRKETSHSGPWFLPGGRRFLYLRSSSDPGNAGIYVGAIDAKPEEQNLTRLLAAQQNPLYAAPHGTDTGHLLFMREGTLFAQAFDPDRLKLSGEIVRIADQVGTGAGGTASYGFFSVSASGALAYRHGQSGTGSVVWVSHAGQEAAPIATALDRPQNPRLSPDGHKLALIVGTDVWVYDIDGRPPIRLTFGGGAFSPLWTPDGRRIVYEGGNVAVALPADGSGGTPEPMSPVKGHFHPYGWTSDGQIILVSLPGPTQTNDIVKFSVRDKGDVQVVVATPANEGFFGTAVSPDGRWLAYVSDQTGRPEIWVRPYPGPGPAIRISPNGGVEPVWARTGRELYYREQNRLMATAVNAGPEFNFKPATPLFETRYVHAGQPPTYDVGADGRFVMIKAESSVGPPFNIVLNWAAGLPARPAR
jgi:eukaryotic-like serine/threonine-protein kinase